MLPLLMAAETAASTSAAGLFSVESLTALATLTALEVVLGIDNIVFIAILAGKLPEEQRDKARKMGLGLAVISRVALLLVIGWVVQLDKVALFNIAGNDVTIKGLVLIVGGLFLMGKATYEIHHRIQHTEQAAHGGAVVHSTLKTVLLQVMMVDVVFSLDSVITAVGMTTHIPVMIAAVLISVGIMLIFSGHVVRFIDKNPAIKILALSFLLLIGLLLIAEGMHAKNILPKGYVYFGMAYALFVDILQMLATPKPKPIVNSDD